MRQFQIKLVSRHYFSLYVFINNRLKSRHHQIYNIVIQTLCPWKNVLIMSVCKGSTRCKRMWSWREFLGEPWKLSIPKTKLNLKSIFLSISGSYSIFSQTSQWQQSLASIEGCNYSKSSYNSYPYFIEISSSCMQIINVKCKWFGSLRCNRTLVRKYKQQRSKSSFDLWNVKNVNLREKRKI